MGRYAAGMYDKKLRIYAQDNICANFEAVTHPEIELQQGAWVVDINRGLGTVVASDTYKNAKMSVRAMLPTTPRTKKCRIDDLGEMRESTTVAIKYSSGLVHHMTGAEACANGLRFHPLRTPKFAIMGESTRVGALFEAMLSGMRALLDLIKPTRKLHDVVNNVRVERMGQADGIDVKDYWLSKWSSLFEDYNEQRFGYMAGTHAHMHACTHACTHTYVHMRARMRRHLARMPVHAHACTQVLCFF